MFLFGLFAFVNLQYFIHICHLDKYSVFYIENMYYVKIVSHSFLYRIRDIWDLGL